MSIVVICPQGHRAEFDDVFAGKATRCPLCAEPVQVPDSAAPAWTPNSIVSEPAAPDAGRRALKGLWHLMRPADSQEVAEPPVASAAPDAPSSPVAVGDSGSEPVAANRPRSLFEVMGHGGDAPVAELETEAASPVVSAPSPTESSGSPLPPPTARGRGLWLLMRPTDSPPVSPAPAPIALDKGGRLQQRPPTGEPPAEGFDEPIIEDDSLAAPKIDRRLQVLNQRAAEIEADLREPSPPERSTVPPPAAPPVAAPPRVGPPVGLPRPAPPPLVARPCGRASAALHLGLWSVPLSFLAVWPMFWSRLPAGLLGFAAVTMGGLALNEIDRSRGRLTGRRSAQLGLLFGILGTICGPLVVPRLQLLEKYSADRTRGRLQAIGTALSDYHLKSAVYPPGGIYIEDGGPGPRFRHGWMTLLLPFLGETELAARVDPSVAYSDERNLPVFQQRVAAFQAAGGDSSLVGGRYGPAHFAGVGGEIILGDGGSIHLGIFEANSAVTRDDVTDGASQTLVAGEISSEIPAWGDPENWRQIGTGLNRDAKGFGGADGRGAFFLMADGSVRYFGKDADPRLLRRLATRDGDDPVKFELDQAK